MVGGGRRRRRCYFLLILCGGECRARRLIAVVWLGRAQQARIQGTTRGGPCSMKWRRTKRLERRIDELLRARSSCSSRSSSEGPP